MTESEIQNLPTLMDVMEGIALNEESFLLDPGPFKGLFPTHYEEGMCQTITDEDGVTQLWPSGIVPFVYYRGESEYHPTCKASLYRPNMTPAKIFLERLRACELELIMSEHPLVDIFKNGIAARLPNGKMQHLQLSVDYLALAQHYGIKTELLDLTVNKWVAAFFACTKYVNGVYEPITDKGGYGVVYSINEQIQDILPGIKMSERVLRAVGLQPFSRPAEQAGYVFKMKDNQNFNDLCTKKVLFRQVPEVSELVFNYANRSKKLFPYDPLQDKAKAICGNNTTFSQAAYDIAISRYFTSQPVGTIDSWMKEGKVKLQEKPVAYFTEKEKQEFINDWPHKERSVFDKIWVRYTEYDSSDTKEDGFMV